MIWNLSSASPTAPRSLRHTVTMAEDRAAMPGGKRKRDLPLPLRDPHNTTTKSGDGQLEQELSGPSTFNLYNYVFDFRCTDY